MSSKSKFVALIIFYCLLVPTLRESQAQGQTRLVLAFYYAWYDPSSFGPGITPFQPPSPYYSTDPAVIQRHVGEARSAGIDGFVQSWYGPSPNQTESNLQTLLDIASSNSFHVAVDFEVGSPYFSNNNDRTEALNYLISTHTSHPAYLRVDGKPVIFFWANWLLSVDNWAAIRNQVDPGHNTIWIAEGANSDYLAVFDGLHLYNTAWADNPASVALTWGSNTRSAASTYGAYKYWIATAMPGFDDSLLGRGDATIVRDRSGGTYYQSSFSSAASSAPDMLLITSFNEWAEGSHIEPSVEFGNFYLQLTSQMSASFKSGSAVPAPPIQPPSTKSSPVQPGLTPTKGPSPTPTKKPTATLFPTPVASPTPQLDGSIVYEIQFGDTIFGIADLFDIPVQDLYEFNDLESSSILRIGQELIIAYASVEAVATDEGFPDTSTRADGTVIYMVDEGDTLIGIAAKYGLELNELFELNASLSEESILRVGQEVIVGIRPIPEDIGGSSQLASPESTATPIQVQEQTPTATPSPTRSAPLLTAETTSSPDLVQEIEPADIRSNSIFSNQTMMVVLGVSVLLAGAGGAMLFLSRRA
ncbi:MAG: endo-1,3-alpha-glucanase family glycosylhydrolase [Candidatus Promineifilaceae bacterium]